MLPGKNLRTNDESTWLVKGPYHTPVQLAAWYRFMTTPPDQRDMPRSYPYSLLAICNNNVPDPKAKWRHPLTYQQLPLWSEVLEPNKLQPDPHCTHTATFTTSPEAMRHELDTQPPLHPGEGCAPPVMPWGREDGVLGCNPFQSTPTPPRPRMPPPPPPQTLPQPLPARPPNPTQHTPATPPPPTTTTTWPWEPPPRGEVLPLWWPRTTEAHLNTILRTARAGTLNDTQRQKLRDNYEAGPTVARELLGHVEFTWLWQGKHDTHGPKKRGGKRKRHNDDTYAATQPEDGVKQEQDGNSLEL